jgi:hypothetical protein
MVPTARLDFSKGVKSGFLFLSIGVGTVMIKISQSFMSTRFDEKLK